jgi:sphingomyelin phosphodiesterase 2
MIFTYDNTSKTSLEASPNMKPRAAVIETDPALAAADQLNLPADAPNDVKVASFNVWGLLISKHRAERIKAIAEHLKTSDYGVVGLQELWMRTDYEMLAEELSGTFPFSYYFKSGQIGSGMATFSRYPIQQAMFHRFMLNGQAHHIWHGDWWSGKGVGLTRIAVSQNFSINFYNTHLHAEYDKEEQYYLGHRISQLQQLLQFVQMSSAVHETEKYLNIIVGDLNTMPNCVSFDLFFKKDIIGMNLLDAAQVYSSSSSTTLLNSFNLSGNTFGKSKDPEQRIDYILYKGTEGIQVGEFGVLTDDKLACDGQVSLSDHSLIWSKFALTNKNTKAEAPAPTATIEEQISVIKQAIAILSKDIHYTKKSQKRHIALSIVQLILFLAITIGVSLILTFDTLPLFITLLAFIVAPGLLIGAILSAIIAVVWLPDELAHLHGFASQWNLALAARGLESMPVTGIVEAMNANPEAIEQMCTITGQKFDKVLIKQLLKERQEFVKLEQGKPASDAVVIEMDAPTEISAPIR